MRRVAVVVAALVLFTLTGGPPAQADTVTRAEHLVTSERTNILVKLTTGSNRYLPRGSTFLGALAVYNPAGCWLVINVYNGGAFQYRIETATAGWRTLPGYRWNKVRLDC